MYYEIGSISLTFFRHVTIDLFMEEVIEIGIFFHFLLPFRSLEFLINFNNIFEVVKSKFPRTHIHNKLWQKI